MRGKAQRGKKNVCKRVGEREGKREHKQPASLYVSFLDELLVSTNRPGSTVVLSVQENERREGG